MTTPERPGFWNFWLVRMVVAVLVAVAIRLLVAVLDGAGATSIVSRAVGMMIGVLTIVGLSKIDWIQADLNGLQPPKPARGLLIGMLVGTALYSAVVFVALVAGWYAVTSAAFDASAFFGAFALLLIAAAFEEVLFRGVLFQTLERASGTGWALFLSGLLFGATHLGNENATVIGAVAVGLAGIALASVYAWTRDLWLLTGLHLMWNFTQGPVFGVAVSGNAFQSWLIPKIQGPEIFTGGIFGFEAGIITIALCLVGTVFALRQTRGLQRWRNAR